MSSQCQGLTQTHHEKASDLKKNQNQTTHTSIREGKEVIILLLDYCLFVHAIQDLCSS